jgi:hypothetical protein
MALGSTQPLVELWTRNISWGGKHDRCVGLTTIPTSCDCLEILGAANTWSPQDLSGNVQGLLYLFTLTYTRLLSILQKKKLLILFGEK